MRKCFTVFVDLLFFTNESSHPQTVVVEKDNTLVGWKLLKGLLKQVSALLVLPQIEETPGYHESIVELLAVLPWLGVELVIWVGVVRYERLQQKRTLQLFFRSDAEQELTNPAFTAQRTI